MPRTHPLRVRFSLITEGTSDHGLQGLLEHLLVEGGAQEAHGQCIDLSRLPQPPGTRLEEKIRATLRIDHQIDLLFVHRDSDGIDPAVRRAEIEAAVGCVPSPPLWIPVVIDQELEAWLLLHEPAIRAVAGNPRGTRELDLPRPFRVENISQPKERLKEALAEASELRGSRLQRFKKKFPVHRRALLARVDLAALREVPSFQALVQAIDDRLTTLATRAQPTPRSSRSPRSPHGPPPPR